MKCHSHLFYGVLYAEIDRVLLDRHKQELQRVIVECVRCRLDQLNAIAGVGSHVSINQATRSEVDNYIAVRWGRLTIQSHIILWSTCHCFEGVYKIRF